MTYWLFEDVSYVTIFGILLIGILGIVYVQTFQRIYAWGMAGVVLTLCLLVFVEQWVITDKEAIETTIYEMQAALEANDFQGLLNHIDPEAEPIRRQAQLALSSITIERVALRDIVIAIDRSSEVPTAEAEFVATIRMQPRAPFPNQGFVRLRFLLLFHNEAEQDWKMLDYFYGEPTGQPTKHYDGTFNL
ncbi:Hypothetical protein PBC10988_11230 [Planctomycetales bacterium 10988]|nr:Hypothetical protein PBC10988_11230 [Planctomycetales bacterium 10988]